MDRKAEKKECTGESAQSMELTAVAAATAASSSSSSKRGRGKFFGAAKGGGLKEKRARLYIIRRCILMLICWRESAD